MAKNTSKTIAELLEEDTVSNSNYFSGVTIGKTEFDKICSYDILNGHKKEEVVESFDEKYKQLLNNYAVRRNDLEKMLLKKYADKFESVFKLFDPNYKVELCPI